MTALNVWFMGKGSRTISKADWKNHSIVADSVTWNSYNGWSIPHSAFTDDQLAILQLDAKFLLGQTGPRLVPNPSTLQELYQSGYVYYQRIMDIYNDIPVPTGGGGGVGIRPRLFHIDDYGGDPSGDTDSNQALVDAYSELGDEPGLIVFGVGNYLLYTGLNVHYNMSLGLYQGVIGQGAGLSRIDYRGEEAFVECRNLDWEFNTASEPSGGVNGIYIFGWANTNSNSGGIRFGDINRMRIDDVHIAGFNQPGGYGIWGDNQLAWSERNDIKCSAEQCTTTYIFESNSDPGGPAAGLSSSFDYSKYDLKFVVLPDQDAFVLRAASRS